MSERPRLLRALALALALTGAGGAAAATPEQQRLLRESDLFANAPAELRVRLAVSSPGVSMRVELEVWRSGRDRILVRFLAPHDRGKYLLRNGAESWLIAPGAKAPVKLGAGQKLAGGLALDEILGLDLAASYRIVGLDSAGGVATLRLEARPDAAAPPPFPALRWVVNEKKRLPMRADFLLADGRTARVLEVSGWRDERRRVPARLVFKDVLRGSPQITVDLLAFEGVKAPPGLFDPADPIERRRLEAAP